ncbi:hypothetical protein [uncultured Streptomyces sp.]|uniref:hypothetical protein n=1 Tax=uncultured Streptomyces sp. TaxID=174707 RepID=UPI002636A137|nr:hypothetical protein [uncultured Streptomyces sp.]
MHVYLHAAVGFPTVLFSAALVVVTCFWLLVAAGAARPDAFDQDLDPHRAGLGGMPVAVSVSLIVCVGWLCTLTGSALLLHHGVKGGPKALLALAVLTGALLVAWTAVRLVAVCLVPLGLATERMRRALRPIGVGRPTEDRPPTGARPAVGARQGQGQGQGQGQEQRQRQRQD